MGWTSYHATHYKRNGSIDRKAELDYELFCHEGEDGHKLVKSSMVGAVYYAAVHHPKGHVYGLVVLTQTDMKDYYNFYYKDMSEDMHPFYYDCPQSILKLLSPTDYKGALEWRENCKKAAEKKKSPTALSNLPIGAQIQFRWGDGVKTVVKHAPAYQFKRPFWFNPADGTYIPAKRIPSDYTVVEAAS